MQLQELMVDAGLEARLDEVANVRGRLNGSKPRKPALLTGSHYDTVKDGGRYDGMLGIIVPIAAVKTLLIQVQLQPSLTNTCLLHVSVFLGVPLPPPPPPGGGRAGGHAGGTPQHMATKLRSFSPLQEKSKPEDSESSSQSDSLTRALPLSHTSLGRPMGNATLEEDPNLCSRGFQRVHSKFRTDGLEL